MANWNINYLPWGGITACFNEQETQSLLSGENTADDIDQALDGIPFLDLITTVLDLWLEAERDLAKSLDKGNGICLLLPWVAIAEGVIGGIIPYPNGNPPAQPNITNNQQHINYITSDGAVHELYYVNNWGHVVVTAAANVTVNSLPNAGGIVSVDGFATPWNGQEHINYTSRDGNVQELVYPPNGPWGNTVLTGPTNADVAPGLRPMYGSPIIGFATYWNQQQHIIFINAALNICELTYATKGGWNFTSVTSPGFADATGVDLPAAPIVTGLSGYGTPWDSGWHINYIAQDGGIHQVYWGEANGWQHASLTSSGFANVTGADLPLSNSPLASYITQWNSTQHVDYIGQDGNVHELYCSTSVGWQHAILSGPALADVSGTNLPASGSSLTAFATPWNQQQHVDYLGRDGGVHELVYRPQGGWSHGVLTTAAKVAGAALPSAGRPFAGYVTLWNQQQHVDYIGQDGKVHELYYADPGPWIHNVLSDLAGADGALPAPQSGLDAYTT